MAAEGDEDASEGEASAAEDGGNPVVTAVHGAPIESSGAFGAAFATTVLPSDVTFGNGVAVDDWVFVVGGKTDLYMGPGVATVFAARVRF
jgi:hypothetical protein